ncbi:hypothetical protein, partial [Smaragdicoccus niigatensis]|uniref:hypothetical protein n=1 Tax=Smaragdicoccus niigatensis TaxID=359359 RepID=UPI0039EF0F92
VVVLAVELRPVEDATGLPAIGEQAAVAMITTAAEPIIERLFRMFMIAILDHGSLAGQVT